MERKPYRKFSKEFKIEAVRLLETSGKSAAQLERDLGIGKGNLTRWRRQFVKEGQDAFPGHGRLTPEQDELRRLKRENEILRQERDILKKAIAIFSERKP